MIRYQTIEIKDVLFYSVCLVAVILLTSCSSSNPKFYQLRTEPGYCYPPINYTYEKNSKLQDDISPLVDSVLKKKYSEHSLMVANATGVLKNLKELHANQSPANAYLKRQQILTQLFLVSTEISSIAAELDCEGERADQVASFLTQRQIQRVRVLTVMSLTTGALAGIGNAIKQRSAAVAFTVVGGSISAALGLGALFSSRKVSFQHPRNLLADIWNEPEQSSLYPPPVWYMLSEKYFSNEKKASIAHNMKSRWIKFEELDSHPKRSEKKIKLFFGPGGNYSDDELRARSLMLNQVQAAVKLMNQDLQGLIEEISK